MLQINLSNNAMHLQRLINLELVELKWAALNIAIMLQEGMICLRDCNTWFPMSVTIDSEEDSFGKTDTNEHFRPRRRYRPIICDGNLQKLQSSEPYETSSFL